MKLQRGTVMAAAILVAGCGDAADIQSPPAFQEAPGVVASATGSAHTQTAGELRLTVFAANRLADGSVSGEFTVNILALGVRWRTSVECVTVTGNRAFLGGTIVDSSDPRVRVGTKSYFWVEDSGPAAVEPDRVSLAGFNETQQGLDDFCGLIQNLLPGRDVLQGDVRVSG